MLEITSSFDNAVLLADEKVELSFTLLNRGDRELEGRPYISLRVNGKQETLIVFDFEKIPPQSQKTYNATLKVPGATGEGTLGFYFEAREGPVASLEYPVFVAGKGEPVYVSFVWHHHQAPQFYPDGRFKDLWAYKHVFEGRFEGFEGGPYSIHVSLHKKYPSFIDVDHFSPSLLEQWEMAVTGAVGVPPEVIQRRQEIETLLETIRQLIAQGRVEPLGSVYAHTILGFILRKAHEKGLVEEAKLLISWEIEQGLSIVEKITGKRPKGFWTPEMFWSMELVDIYHRHGILYTILCEQHFAKAGGDKGTIYEPYILRDPVTSSTLIVFFRDLALSNWVSFNVDFRDEREADISARRFVIELAKRRERAPGGIVVIALDGENWMIMPSYRRYAPYFLKRVIELIEKSQVIRLSSIEKYLEDHEPTRVLTYVPYGSWINLTEAQWTGGVKDSVWEEAFKALGVVSSLYSVLGEASAKLSNDRESEFYRALKALAIAFDSDFYWYGEIEKEREFVKKWAQRSIEIAENFVKRYLKVSVVSRTRNHVVIQLENHSPYPLTASIHVESRNYKNEAQVTLNPKTIRRVPVYTPSHENTQVVIKAGRIVLPATTP
ncbi:hypothetical protein IG193_06555 [Infirmifilum lucidum]|uniref:Glycoside hydrolase family 57 N-terminal domain-containing protein n=1 Tax=Infirmifilum lucidum TaxID=2776706 RepID=A0A7L9FFN0_9CREN|nr:glycoside hydrolase family 57 protein [Infirmifilum lucidum]QOJ78411.1 hypothetical protein IG193_06555 [Infirmifilum lucidum]